MTSKPILRQRNPAHRTEAWAREFAEAIEVPAGVTTLLLSGVGPAILDVTAEPDTFAAYGNTAAQTRSVMQQIQAILRSRGYDIGDIVSMQALIVGDPELDGEPDFQGFSTVYNEYFGTPEQHNVPARTRAQVQRLVPPGWLVEVTITAAACK